MFRSVESSISFPQREEEIMPFLEGAEDLRKIVGGKVRRPGVCLLRGTADGERLAAPRATA